MPDRFLSCKSRVAEDLLIAWRSKLDVVLDRPCVLLACLSNASIEPTVTRDFDGVFNATCLRIFSSHEGHFPKRPNGRPCSIACAWFDVEFNGVEAALDIQQQVLKLDNRTHVHIAVGQDEMSAFRLLRMAGDDQIVIHPKIWGNLTHEVRSILQYVNAHEPDYEQLDALTKHLTQQFITSVPWKKIAKLANAKKKVVKPSQSRKSKNLVQRTS